MSPSLVAVVGTRPNFVKVAPVVHATVEEYGLGCSVVHTGQHYDRELSDSFIEQLELPAPDHYLGVGSGTHAEQTARVLVGVERVLCEQRPFAVLVPGDVNSTLAAALAAAKLHIPVIHLESGLRSGDWTMPEEVNRVLTDRLSDLLLCPSEDAVENLAREGIAADRIAVVGNTMIDSLLRLLDPARDTHVRERLGLTERGYVLVTLHRPALVDDPTLLTRTLAILDDIGRELPVVLPLHPRTRSRLRENGRDRSKGLRLLDPLSYLEFIALEADARLVITDSGGVQEETSVLGVPCVTYRTTTERPITIELGTNRLVGTDPAALYEACIAQLRNGFPVEKAAIPLWDGRAGVRAAAAIDEFTKRTTAA